MPLFGHVGSAVLFRVVTDVAALLYAGHWLDTRLPAVMPFPQALRSFWVLVPKKAIKL